MITSLVGPASTLGIMLALIAVGCSQPRVYVTTSTTVGLEATPPMSDGSGMPKVMFGYKRAEVAFIPVCSVERYKYTWDWLDKLFVFAPNNIEKCQDKITAKDQSTRLPPPSMRTSTQINEQETYMNRHDAYSTLGLFRLGLSWFGPAKIEQFVATGLAARAIQVPPKRADKPEKTSSTGATNENQRKSGNGSSPLLEGSGSPQPSTDTKESSRSTETRN